MNILSITAGAAGMYCGSCFRDNALAAELIAQGHDVTLIPVYTPTLTDEDNVSRPDVLFGGISVYLQQQSAVFRRLPRVFDRLLDSPRIINAFAGRGVSADAKTLGELTISMLEGERGVLRKEFDKLIDWTRDEPRPDVINLPNSLLISMAAPLRKTFGRPVCCTLQGEELFIDGLVPAYRERALALMRELVPTVDRFIAVSEYCADFMSRLLRIPPTRMAVVPLGISMKGYSRRNRPQPTNASTFHVGYFARVAPEKGLQALAEAYVRLRRRMGSAPAALDVAGYMAPNHRPYLEQARGTLERAGVGAEFTYRGAIDRAAKLEFMRGIDVLSVPATYDEPKGMFLLEAMAAGVPVVQPRRGAFIEVVEKTRGGLLVDRDDPDALADGLYALWADPSMVERLGAAAYDGVRAHYHITQSASRLLDVYGALQSKAA
jgi:glycosyltransferase involved in cell wall biosynthesis